jgi:hypothetical protein
VAVAVNTRKIGAQNDKPSACCQIFSWKQLELLTPRKMNVFKSNILIQTYSKMYVSKTRTQNSDLQ